MSDQPKRDEAESGSKDEESTVSRRAFLGVGGVGLASVAGLGFAQRNGTNTTNGSGNTAGATGNGGRGQQNGSGPSNGTNSNSSESENDGGNDKNERGEGNEQGGKNGEKESDNGTDSNEQGEQSGESENDGGNDKNEKGEKSEQSEKNEVKPSQVSLSDQQARDAATKRVSGTVQSVDLGNQNGTPAYEVTVKTAGGSTKDVAVNANTGDVLSVGNED